MAKRHSADDELSAALAILHGIEAEMAALLPETVEQSADARAEETAGAEPTHNLPSPKLENADAAGFVAGIDAASGQASPLVHFVRHLDADIQRIIAQASDTEILSFPEKLLRRLHLSRTPQDMHRRDGVLADRLVSCLERAARLVGALDSHREVAKARLLLMEDDLVERIDHTKSIGDETGAMASAAEQLTSRQDIIEAAIRHEAACNSLYHKLVIETERGIVVLRALVSEQDVSIAERFSSDAQGVLSPLLALCDKGMLSMREVDRRRHAVNETFQHRFSFAPARHAENGNATGQTPQTQQASA